MEDRGRVILEMNDLESKLSRLREYVSSAAYSKMAMFDKNLLDTQRYHMSKYLEVLIQRINVFKSK